MTLVLSIQGVDTLENGAPTMLRLVRHGAIVGRSVHADWSLPDRKNHLSSRHCEISYRDGTYVLTDRSTNGTFVNGATERLSAPHRIANGDRIVIGAYEVLAECAGAASPPAAVVGAGWGEWNEVAPASSSQPASPTANTNDEAVPLPFDGGGWDTPAPLSVSAWASEPSEQSSPSAAQLWGELAERGTKAVDTVLPPPPAVARGWGALEDVPTRGSEPQNDSTEPRDPELDVTVPPRTDLMLRMLGGLAALVEARARAKADLGVVSTTIELDGNNPIKFIRSPERMLDTLLQPPQPGFMPAELAIDDAFRDIQLHEMATAAAMRAAIEQTIKRFSPAAIRARRRGGGWLAKLLPQARAAALWHAYEDEFEGVVRDADEAFMDLFSKAFRTEYARCLDAAAAARPRR